MNILEILKLDAPDDDKINFLIHEANIRLSDNLLTRFINEIGNENKIKDSSPMELLNCIMKLLRIIKDFGDSPRFKLLQEKLQGVKESINLSEIAAPQSGSEIKNPDTTLGEPHLGNLADKSTEIF